MPRRPADRWARARRCGPRCIMAKNGGRSVEAHQVGVRGVRSRDQSLMSDCRVVNPVDLLPSAASREKSGTADAVIDCRGAGIVLATSLATGRRPTCNRRASGPNAPAPESSSEVETPWETGRLSIRQEVSIWLTRPPRRARGRERQRRSWCPSSVPLWLSWARCGPPALPDHHFRPQRTTISC